MVLGPQCWMILRLVLLILCGVLRVITPFLVTALVIMEGKIALGILWSSIGLDLMDWDELQKSIFRAIVPCLPFISTFQG